MINKIKALLAMAADPGASEQERETATRQAAKLMAKHEIDEYDILVAQGSDYDLTEQEAVGMRPGKKSGSKVPPWIGIIAYGVKTFCNVRVVKRGVWLSFRGPRAQVELATWMHEALVSACYIASKGQPNPNAFRNGYAAAIQARLMKMALPTDESSVGTSLVVVRARLNEAMDAKWGEEGTGVSKKVSQSSAGRIAGQSAHIPTTRPINSNSAPQLAHW